MLSKARAPSTVVVVERHALLLAGLCAELGRDPSLRVIGHANDSAAGLECVANLRPDVAIVDVSTAGTADFDVRLVCELRRARPFMGIVVLARYEHPREVLSAIACQADGYCATSATPDRIITAVETVASGEAHIDAPVAVALLRHLESRFLRPSRNERFATKLPLDSLEMNVLHCLAAGFDYADVASAIQRSEYDVHRLVRNIVRSVSATVRSAG